MFFRGVTGPVHTSWTWWYVNLVAFEIYWYDQFVYLRRAWILILSSRVSCLWCVSGGVSGGICGDVWSGGVRGGGVWGGVCGGSCKSICIGILWGNCSISAGFRVGMDSMIDSRMDSRIDSWISYDGFQNFWSPSVEKLLVDLMFPIWDSCTI